MALKENQSSKKAIVTSNRKNDEFLAKVKAEPLFKGLTLSCRIIDFNDCAISCIKSIEYGCSGKVTVGKWMFQKVAVKSINVTKRNESNTRNELAIMDRLKHPNIISLLAVAVNTTHCYLICEKFDGINLKRLIFDDYYNQKYSLTYDNKITIASQICAAMLYLHDPQYQIICQNLQPENIMINNHKVIKLWDFQHSSSMMILNAWENRTPIINEIQGTPKYLAPELVLNDELATTYSDIWSLSCILYELFTSKPVWINDHIASLYRLYEEKRLPNLFLIKNTYLKDILRECFDYNPTGRPSIQELFFFFLSNDE